MEFEERACADPQKRRLYKAEREAFFHYPRITVCKAKLFLASIISSEWYTLKKHPPVELHFMESKIKQGAVYHYAYYQNIFLSQEYMTEADVIHELSHAVIDCSRGNNPHGKAFCRRYLGFTRMYLSEDDYQRLKGSFIKYRVEW